jgi:hypothetical protein
MKDSYGCSIAGKNLPNSSIQIRMQNVDTVIVLKTPLIHKYSKNKDLC